MNGIEFIFLIILCIIGYLVYLGFKVAKIMVINFIYNFKCFLKQQEYRNRGYIDELSKKREVRKKANNLNIEKMIFDLTPREFELFIAEVFKYNGYKAQVTQATSDGGKDIVLTEKYTNEEIYVECKLYKGNNTVGREMVQKLLGAAILDGVNRCIFVNTGRYTQQALECESEYIELWDLKRIVKECKRLDDKEINNVVNKTKMAH